MKDDKELKAILDDIWIETTGGDARLTEAEPELLPTLTKLIDTRVREGKIEVAENVYTWAREWQPDNKMLINATRNAYEELKEGKQNG